MSKTQVLVVANCQGPFIARALELLHPGIAAKSIVVFQADKTKAAQYNKMIATSDFVFHFNVKPGFFLPALEARNIRSAVGDRSKTITNLFFSGLHPDFCYVGGMNQRKPGPFGEYHSRFAITGYKLGLPAAETAALMGDAGLQEQLGYRDAFQNSIDELKHRDTELDIRFASVLEPMMKGGALPMFTFNHPTPWVLLELARHILGEVGLEASRIPYEVVPSWLQGGRSFRFTAACRNGTVCTTALATGSSPAPRFC